MTLSRSTLERLREEQAKIESQGGYFIKKGSPWLYNKLPEELKKILPYPPEIIARGADELEQYVLRLGHTITE